MYIIDIYIYILWGIYITYIDIYIFIHFIWHIFHILYGPLSGGNLRGQNVADGGDLAHMFDGSQWERMYKRKVMDV